MKNKNQKETKKKKEIKKNTEVKDENYWLPIGMGIGLCIGVITNNIGLWLPVGLGLGVSLGAAFAADNENKNNKKK